MTLSSLTLLTIAERGWGDKRAIVAGDVSASWSVSRPGKLSAILDARRAWLLDVDDYVGKWVRWDHPTCGAWGGVVQDAQCDLQRGTVELSCDSFHDLLAKRRTPATYRQASAPAGSLVLRAITDAGVDDPVPLDSAVADEDGPLFQFQWRGQELLSIVSGMASTAAMDYDVTLDDDTDAIALEFRRRVGRDQTGSVLLVEGYHVIDGTITRSRANLVNDRLAVSADQNYQDAAITVVVDGDSIAAYGRRQDTARYPNVGDAWALATRARADLQTLASPQNPVSIRVPDNEKQLTDVRTGDTIRLWSASANATYAFRVMNRAVMAAQGIVTLSGDAEVAA